MTVVPPDATPSPEAQPAIRPKPRPAARQRSGWIISKTVVNFWLDALLMVIFCVLCWTQAVLQYIFPIGIEAEGWTLWGLTFDNIQTFQFTLFSIFALGVTVHVTLHWPWVCGVVVSKLLFWKKAGKPQVSDGVRTLWGVGTLVIICNVVGGVLALAYLMIERPQ